VNFADGFSLTNCSFGWILLMIEFSFKVVITVEEEEKMIYWKYAAMRSSSNSQILAAPSSPTLHRWPKVTHFQRMIIIISDDSYGNGQA